MIVYKEELHQGDYTWIHFEKPSSEELELIHTNHQLPKDFISDAYDIFEVARTEFLEKEADHPKLILVQSPFEVENEDERIEFDVRALSIIISNHRIITLSYQTPDFIHQLWERFFGKNNDSGHQLDLGGFILELLLLNERSYVQALRRILADIERMQVDVVHSSKNHELYRQMAIEKSLVILKSAIESNEEVFQSIHCHPLTTLTEEHENKLHDLLVESQQAQKMSQMALSLSEHLSGIFENVISNNLNLIMKVLTSITVILTIPTIIGGIWGMNVALPFANHPHAFTILGILTLILSVVTYFILKKYDFF